MIESRDITSFVATLLPAYLSVTYPVSATAVMRSASQPILSSLSQYLPQKTALTKTICALTSIKPKPTEIQFINGVKVRLA
jgi:hypothetical protein